MADTQSLPPPAYSAGDRLIAKWSPATGETASYLDVTVIENTTPGSSTANLYRCQTNMGITMVIPESDLARPPNG